MQRIGGLGFRLARHIACKPEPLPTLESDSLLKSITHGQPRYKREPWYCFRVPYYFRSNIRCGCSILFAGLEDKPLKQLDTYF